MNQDFNCKTIAKAALSPCPPRLGPRLRLQRPCTAIGHKAPVQLMGAGNSGFQRKNKGLRQKETGGIHIAFSFFAVSSNRVKLDQLFQVMMGMGRKERCMERCGLLRGDLRPFCVHDARPASIWVATQ